VDALDPAWGDAMNRVFALSSKSSSVSGNFMCTKSIANLMVSQNIPSTAAGLRALNDTEILQIAMLASVASISMWKRDAPNNALFQLTEQGRLVSPHTPNAVESDVMLCIICALLIVIAVFHLSPATI
jgi:hypothetical protein